MNVPPGDKRLEAAMVDIIIKEGECDADSFFFFFKYKIKE